MFNFSHKKVWGKTCFLLILNTSLVNLVNESDKRIGIFRFTTVLLYKVSEKNTLTGGKQLNKQQTTCDVM